MLLNKYSETQSQFGMFANFSILFVAEASVNPGGFELDFEYSVWWVFALILLRVGGGFDWDYL